MTDWQTEYDEAIAAPLRAEIERLKEGWKIAFNIGVSEQEQNKKQRAEIERLKADNERLKEAIRRLLGKRRSLLRDLPPLNAGQTMREWLVIESARNKAVFAPDGGYPTGYIPREVAEKLLGRDLGGRVWFRKDENEKMRAHPDWRDSEPGWSPLGFWS